MSDVLVVGAGPTGLALACGLRLAGVSVRVVDGAGGPAATSRANFLHARGSEVLDRLGALGTLPDESQRAMSVTTYLGGRPLTRLKFGDPELRTAGPPMVISQARVEDELRRRLARLGVEPEWGARVVCVEQDVSGVTAGLDTGETIRAGWVVGCDGTSSTVRAQAQIPAASVQLSERFLLADMHLGWDVDRSGTTGWIHPSGLLGVMPMPHLEGDLWRILAYDPEEGAGERLTDEQVLHRIREILPERTGHAEVRIGEPEWVSQFVIHRRLADAYRAGRIFLAGDAAHAHSPFGGQGMLSGLGDAENLAWKLALVVHGRAGSALLDTYEAERRPLARDVLRGTSAVTAIDVSANPIGRVVRDRILAPLMGLPWVQRKATWAASQLWVTYRRGPLGRRGGPTPRPGDRVGDLPCIGVEGAVTRLHAQLGGAWALLCPAGREASVPEPLGDLAVVLGRTDDGKDTWLVRPDGHLAWRGTDPHRMEEWLAGALGGGR